MSRETTEALRARPLVGPTVPVREWTVEVVQGPDKGKRFTTLGRLVRVGTEETNDLVLEDGTVSRRHLELEWQPQGLVVKDLASRNGTFVDGRRVLAAYLQPKDRVDLGKTRLQVLQQDAPTQLEVAEADSFHGLVGTSEAMRIVFADLRRVADDDVTVLLEGETGTGKDLAARAIHAESLRHEGPFRVVDCPLLEGGNAEAELFGPEGGFLGADGGTLFLDEVGELPAPVQPKLLRVLERKEVPLPGKPAVPIDVRIVASTQKNLSEEVQKGRFRQDLFFRIAVVRIRLPPLRTRKGDIPLLARALQGRGQAAELSERMLSLLEGYDWPGNVRELRNVLERATLTSADTHRLLEFVAAEKPARGMDEVRSELAYHEAKDRVVADFERAYLTEVMRQLDFDLQRAEKHTGLSVQSLYRLLKKNGLRIKDLRNTSLEE